MSARLVSSSSSCDWWFYRRWASLSLYCARELATRWGLARLG